MFVDVNIDMKQVNSHEYKLNLKRMRIERKEGRKKERNIKKRKE